jgi:hypothetical protein
MVSDKGLTIDELDVRRLRVENLEIVREGRPPDVPGA